MAGVPRSIRDKATQDIARIAGDPDPTGMRVTHCIVAAVNDKNQVQVKPLGGAKEKLLGGDKAWHAVVPDLLEIHRRWGQIRPGMFCRAYWTGKVNARHVYYVEILGKDMITSKKEPRDNDIENNHFAFLSGGGWGKDA